MGSLREHPVVQLFADAMRSYQAFIDDPPGKEFSRACLVHLTTLYGLWLRLPHVEPGEAKPERLSYPLSEKLSAAIGERNAHWLVYNPFEEEAPVASSIYEDLTSIYEDLVPALVLFERGDDDALQRAVWEWYFAMESHSGRHLVFAMTALHERLTDAGEG